MSIIYPQRNPLFHIFHIPTCDLWFKDIRCNIPVCHECHEGHGRWHIIKHNVGATRGPRDALFSSHTLVINNSENNCNFPKKWVGDAMWHYSLPVETFWQSIIFHANTSQVLKTCFFTGSSPWWIWWFKWKTQVWSVRKLHHNLLQWRKVTYVMLTNEKLFCK